MWDRSSKCQHGHSSQPKKHTGGDFQSIYSSVCSETCAREEISVGARNLYVS